MPLRADAQLDPGSRWPKWASDNRNTGRAVKSLPSGLVIERVRWRRQLETLEAQFRYETLERGMVLGADERLLVPTNTGRLLCYDAATGNLLWTFETDAFHRE